MENIEVIETDRLIMRRLMPEDYKAMAAWDMDEKVYEYLPSLPCKSEEEPLVWLPKKDPYSKTNILMLVTDKNDGHPIGIYALNYVEEHDSYSLSYVNRHEDWGKGYTVEGMKALMDHAVKEYGAHKFEAECAKENIGSAKVMEKLGLSFVRESSYQKNDGSKTFESVVYEMEIENEEYLANDSNDNEVAELTDEICTLPDDVQLPCLKEKSIEKNSEQIKKDENKKLDTKELDDEE